MTLKKPSPMNVLVGSAGVVCGVSNWYRMGSDGSIYGQCAFLGAHCEVGG